MTSTVGRLVTGPPVTVSPAARLLDAATLMARHSIGLLVLVDPKDPQRAVGVLSERDIIRAVASGADLRGPVESFATRTVVQVAEGASVAEAARQMREHRIRHLVVADSRGMLKGVVSIRDLMGEDHTLRAIIGTGEPEYPATD